MARFRIAWLPGDGIGPEVMSAARIVLDALSFDAEYVPADIGWACWQAEGDPLPERTLGLLRRTDCALLGAVTSKPGDDAERELAPHLRATGLRYFSPIVRLRQTLDLHTNLRPCRAYPGNPSNVRDDVDLVVFRENTEGLYGGIEWYPLPRPLAEQMAAPRTGHPGRMRPWLERGLGNVALSTRLMSRQGCERICRNAFAYARQHGRRRVTLVEKPNVLRETGGLMTTTFRAVAEGFPGIEATEANVDAACMWLVQEPGRYDVLVAENMFGDVISDLGAGLAGGLGYACSANLGDEYAVFEPSHGSAPDIAGTGTANPVAMILTARMMLEWLGETRLASRLEQAVAGAIADGRVDEILGRGPAQRTATDAVAAEIAGRITS